MDKNQKNPIPNAPEINILSLVKGLLKNAAAEGEIRVQIVQTKDKKEWVAIMLREKDK